MIDPTTLVPFVLASAILVLIPGPAVMYIVSTGVSRGRRAAIASVLGIETGAVVHVVAAAVGASALVASSAVAFSVLKYAGALYLFYLGWKTLRSSDSPLVNRVAIELSPWRSFGRGVLVNALNPKVALFFLAFIPQFVNPDRGQVAVQFLSLGAIFIGVAFVIDTSYAFASGVIGRLVARSPRVATMQKRFAGFAYIALGASAALTGNSSE
ncbi:LysE family translocator [soil metagenome]